MTAPISSPNRVEVPLRWRDLDHLGHVYHGTMLTLLDEARTQWFIEHLGIDSADSYVVARIEIDYRGETRRDSGSVAVEFSLTRIGRTSLTTREVVTTLNGSVVVEAVVTAVLWDTEQRCPRPITGAERERMHQLDENTSGGTNSHA